jgi:hypothetical protein
MLTVTQMGQPGGTPSPDTPAVRSQGPTLRQPLLRHPKHLFAWGFLFAAARRLLIELKDLKQQGFHVVHVVPSAVDQF